MMNVSTLLLDIAPNPAPMPIDEPGVPLVPIVIGAVAVVLVVVAVIAIVRARKKTQ